MRYKFKPSPKRGDTRIITKFLWFPTIIDEELRWMERVKILQQYRVLLYDKWRNYKWMN